MSDPITLLSQLALRIVVWKMYFSQNLSELTNGRLSISRVLGPLAFSGAKATQHLQIKRKQVTFAMIDCDFHLPKLFIPSPALVSMKFQVEDKLLSC